MQLESLRVLNLSKKLHSEALAAFSASTFLPGIFCLNSCQRYLWICDADSLRGQDLPGIIEVRAGREAYELLLRVATGLESQIVGETDIFGQLKEAWKSYFCANSRARELDFWMQRVFEDTKEIRSEHLRNQGGNSYGSLVRKMIRDHIEKTGRHLRGPVLLIGAGQIAQAVAPYLTDYEVLLSNRSRARLDALKTDLENRENAGVRVIEESELPEAWEKAAFAVVCIPFNSADDAGRIRSWLKGGDAVNRLVIHLGGLHVESGDWRTLPSFRSLDNLFELQRAQDEARSLSIVRARKACDERSKLRSLGAQVGLPHGWEDLAIFA